MCVVSNVGDRYSRQENWPSWPPIVPFPDKSPVQPKKDDWFPYPPSTPPEVPNSEILKELQKLRKQVEEMKRELEAAKQQDIDEGNPDCEMEEKVVVLRKITKLVGVDLSEVFPNDPS